MSSHNVSEVACLCPSLFVLCGDYIPTKHPDCGWGVFFLPPNLHHSPAGVFVNPSGELLTEDDLFAPGVGVIEVDNGQGLTNVSDDQVDECVLGPNPALACPARPGAIYQIPSPPPPYLPLASPCAC